MQLRDLMPAVSAAVAHDTGGRQAPWIASSLTANAACLALSPPL
jgi:uncharacterized caspase-like protein